MIHFNVPPCTGNEIKYIKEAIDARKICGDGFFCQKCSDWLEKRFKAKRIMLTTSGSSALDMAALLCKLDVGDEVILPSYTFPSTANSFVMCGAKLVFVDIRQDTMNIDEKKIERAITNRTKVICVVHYAGISCEMDTIMKIARRYNLMVVEDAAQAIMGDYRGQPLGTIGDFGCFSFHETKNFSMGEGGAIVINDPKYIENAEILREKGTNRAKFFRGEIDKYNWVDYGDSYLPSELNAAYLWAQLEKADEITENRLEIWNEYASSFFELQNKGIIKLPFVPDDCKHNGHMFYIKCKDIEERQKYIEYMKSNDIKCVFHYVPLHSSPAGKKFGRFEGSDEYTTAESNKLVRLPLYYNLCRDDLKKVIKNTLNFFDR